MSYEKVLPEGLTEELEANIVLWFDSIVRAVKKHGSPEDDFEFLHFSDFFSNLRDELQDEVIEGQYIDRLTQLSLELMFPKYLRTIKKKIEGILGIKNLNYHTAQVVSYDYISELHVVRVLGGLLYQSYACNPHADELNLVSSNYVPCSHEEISSMCRQMVIECIDSYKPYLPSDKFNHLRVNAFLNSIKDDDYVELVTDVL